MTAVPVLAARSESRAVPATRQVPAALTRWRPDAPLRSWLWALAVTALAAGTRFWALGFPESKSFDELYYATEAQEMLRYGYEDNRDYMFIVHPPLGKWLIAITSAIFGNDAVGWRAAPAVAGVVSVLILVRLAQRMLRSTLLGVLAGTLLALDGISLVMSRVALLDIFLQTFILAGFAALVIDRDQLRGRLGDLYAAGVDLSRGVPSLGPRPWRLIGGVLLGLAFGVKWSALSFWGAFAVLSLVWDRGAWKSAGVEHPWLAVLKRSLPAAVFSLGLAPLAAYFLTWTGWFVGENSWNRHWGDIHSGTGLFALLPSGFRSLLDYHHQAYLFHSHLYDPHAYKANPWSWLVLGRPTSFYAPSGVTGCGSTSCTREILLIGTPIEYWAIIPALLWCLWQWATTRDWRAGTVLMAFLAGWGVWLQNTRRTGFLFYMTPLMPFLMLALTLAVGAMLSRSPGDTVPEPASTPTHGAALNGFDDPAENRDADRDAVRTVGLREWIALHGISMSLLLRAAVVSLWLGAVAADFVWMWPLFTGGMLTNHDWQLRMWFPGWI
ncbi:dolichyl-phosphate-mannose--protein mannosyltransferase [Jatrophihabitans lederbergiae]|uniref:Phospholipid carrier-dependent glycosyltransferase n=1 Tax=Jatrophihabitans lederbergiae TaxID=3075547 RepID=A0ABU2JEN3_9ACTN|nr:phospholipid carrier-dependent glycosyltransferase [Jatrophihabitans sp. DSM 44399]MDT0263139.1 phospholipid carrier-dependent glycosyltransferase [Jatrophihabitans sp. DSM 44399]